jgi:hypothetical protein
MIAGVNFFTVQYIASPGVNTPWPPDPMGVKVTVNVSTKSRKTVCVHWNMAQNKSVHDMVAANIPEVLSVIL